MNAGIDYSRGTANVNTETGIHYGCISLNSLAGHVWEDVESIYPDEIEVECPECHAIHVTSANDWYTCECGREFDLSAEWDFAEPIGQDFGAGTEYSESLNALFVTDSEFYTFGNFCSPCAPGAVDLDSPNPDGVKAYCLGFDWFDSDNPCPYPVYRVSDDTRVWEELTRYNTTVEFWAERDRIHVELKQDDHTIVEFWDEAAQEAFEDGFLTDKGFIMGKLVDSAPLHDSLLEYAKERNLH